jgi:type VI secretion system Hcp family effector
MKKIALSLSLCALLLAFTHPTGFHSYTSFKGSKQGAFKGESTKGKSRDKDGWFETQGYDMGGETPADASKSSSAKGGRQHHTLMITKETDGASPLLLQALNSKEVLETVTIQTVDDNLKPIKTVTVSNALLTGVHTTGSTETLTLSYDHLTTQ